MLTRWISVSPRPMARGAKPGVDADRSPAERIAGSGLFGLAKEIGTALLSGMEHPRSRRYCPKCKRKVVALRRRPSLGVHLILAIVTAGFWIPVWLLWAMASEMMNPVCIDCGTATSSEDLSGLSANR